jgi:hypothetical protein
MVIFNGKTHYKWPYSIAMLNYQRVIFDIFKLPMPESCLQVYTKFSCHGSAFRLASIPSSRSRCVEIWWFLCRRPSATTPPEAKSTRRMPQDLGIVPVVVRVLTYTIIYPWGVQDMLCFTNWNTGPKKDEYGWMHVADTGLGSRAFLGRTVTCRAEHLRRH